MLNQSVEWKNLSLAFLIDSITSGTSTGGEDRRIVDGEVGVLTLSSIANGIFAPNEHRVVPSGRVGELKVSVRAGTLIMSRSNTIDLVGTVAYVDKDYPNLFLSDLLWELTVSESSGVLPKWLGYALSTHKIRREIQKRASGTSGSMKKLSRERFRSIHILIPHQSFQEKSCKLIEQFDSAIALTEKLIAAKHRLKQGLMYKLLSQDTSLNLMKPISWDVGELSKYVSDFIVPMRDKPKSFDGKIPWCRIEDLNGRYLSDSYIPQVDRE